jgi:hypothetical protein
VCASDLATLEPQGYHAQCRLQGTDNQPFVVLPDSAVPQVEWSAAAARRYLCAWLMLGNCLVAAG